MHTGGGEPDDDVALRDIAARQQRAAFDGADCKAGEIVIVVLIEPRHLGGLAADQRAAGLLAADRNAGDHGGADFRLEFSTCVVVEKEQRLGALHHQVVDAHGDQVDADGVVAAGLDRDLDLGADAVIGGHQDRILESKWFEVE